MPTLNSYFISEYDESFVDEVKRLRNLHLGGDKYLGKGVWEVTEETWKKLSHYPHILINQAAARPEPLVLEIDKDNPNGMYHYQEVAAEELRSRKNCLLFFDTGTGKTRTSLLALSSLAKDLEAVIVVGQSNLSRVWMSQVEEHFPEFAPRFMVLNDIPSIPQRVERINSAPKGTIFIINIESMRKVPARGGRKEKKSIVDAFNARNLAVCILDECQCIIGKNSQQTAGMLALQTDFRWALSATPIKNSPLEWHSLLAWLRLFPLDGLITRFKEYYSYATRNRFGQWVYESFRNEQDLEDLKNLVSIRVEKKGLGLQKRNDIDVLLKRDSVYNDLMKSIRKEKRRDNIDIVLNVAGKDIEAENMPSLFYIERLVTAMAKEKIDFILSHLNEQMIVVSCLKFPLDYIHSLIPEDSVLYHGDISEIERQENLDAFIRGDKKVLLMSRKAGGVGLTLTNANIMVFLDAPNNDADFNQCSDRIHRIGQTREVFIYRLKLEGSLDIDAWEHLYEKKGWIDRYYKTNYEERTYDFEQG